MRLKLIACKALFREISYVAALSDNMIDITWMRQGYHVDPGLLHTMLEKEIDAIEEGTDPHSYSIRENYEGDEPEDFDAILLGYGLCSNAIAGIRARNHRLVIPRAHDCITLFLGSKERYASCFKEIPGCYWYTASWIENGGLPGKERRERARRRYEEMGYDEETVEYLLDATDGLKNYHNLAYVKMPFGDSERYIAQTKAAADDLGWKYHEMDGDLRLLERFLAGEWNEEDFLILEPGETAVQSVDGRIIKKAEA